MITDVLTFLKKAEVTVQEAKEINESDRDDYLKKRELLARKYLKYNYDQHNTYKWRYPAAVKLEKELNSFWESRRKR